jgi:hypothetical protein
MQFSKSMNGLSPTAMRFIDIAIRQKADETNAARWYSWAETPDRQMPPYVAQIALHSLSAFALTLETTLEDDEIDPQKAAALENDLGYIAAVEASLTEFLLSPA